MEVFGILGDRGGFKTCFAVSRLRQDFLNGEKITSNIKLKFPHQRRTFQQVRDEVKLMEKTAESDNPYVPSFKGHIIFLDELSTGADSYEFMMKHATELTWLVSQLRKLGCIIYYTDQRFGKVVKRIRDQTDAFYLIRDLDKGKMHHSNGKIARRHRDVCDGRAEYIMVDGDLKVISRKPKKFYGPDWYEFYDTDELVFDNRN